MAVDADLDHAEGDDDGELPAVIMGLPTAEVRDAPKAGEDLEYSKTLPVGAKHTKDLEKEFKANFPDFGQASVSAENEDQNSEDDVD